MTQAKLDKLRKKFAKQSADLINKGGVDPMVLHALLLDCALAVPLSLGISARHLADSLRLHAARLEEDDTAWLKEPMAHA